LTTHGILVTESEPFCIGLSIVYMTVLVIYFV